MTSNLLTSFQVKCEEKLNMLLRESNFPVEKRVLEGIDETFIKIFLQKGIVIYIYEDECEVEFNNNHNVFENYEGRTDEIIINECLSFLRNSLLLVPSKK